MPSYVYYIEPRDDEEIEIDRRMVRSCEDKDKILIWLDGLTDREEILQMQVREFHLNPRDDKESLLWLRRVNMALAATGVGISRVRKRAQEIGAITPCPKSAQIENLLQKNRNLKAEIEALKIVANGADQ